MSKISPTLAHYLRMQRAHLGWLTPEELCHGAMYLLNARNSHLGIWNRNESGFAILREKGGVTALSLEYHWDCGSVHGTAKPWRRVEGDRRGPWEARLRAALARLDYAEYMRLVPGPEPHPSRVLQAPSSGIYFVIQHPAGGWTVRSFRADREGELDHVDAWERHVAAEVAADWAEHRRSRGATDGTLERRLADFYDGFPRGRVVVGGGADGASTQAVVYHGRNLVPAMGLSQQQVERGFGLSEASWVFDEHEQCTRASADGLCAALGIRCNWPVYSDGESIVDAR